MSKDIEDKFEEFSEIFSYYEFSELKKIIEKGILLEYVVNTFLEHDSEEHYFWLFYSDAYKYINSKNPVLAKRMLIDENTLKKELENLHIILNEYQFDRYYKDDSLENNVMYNNLLRDMHVVYNGSVKEWNNFISEYNRITKPIKRYFITKRLIYEGREKLDELTKEINRNKT